MCSVGGRCEKERGGDRESEDMRAHGLVFGVVLMLMRQTSISGRMAPRRQIAIPLVHVPETVAPARPESRGHLHGEVDGRRPGQTRVALDNRAEPATPPRRA